MYIHYLVCRLVGLDEHYCSLTRVTTVLLIGSHPPVYVVVSIYNKNTRFVWNLETIVLILLLCRGECDSSFPQGLGRTYQTALKEFVISDTSLPLTCDLEVCLRAASAQFSCVLEAFCSLTDLKMMSGLCLILYIKKATTNLSYNITTCYTGSNLLSYVHAYCSHRNDK